MNRYVRAWVEAKHHAREHSSTGERPLERWKTHRPAVTYPTPDPLDRLFWQWDRRKVSTTAIIKLHGNQSHVDPSLAGRRVRVRYDPFNLERVIVCTNENRPTPLCEGTVEGPLMTSRAPSPTPAPSRRPSAAAQRRLQALEQRLEDHLGEDLDLTRFSPVQEEC